MLPLAHSDWVTRTDRCSLGSQTCLPASRCQTVAGEDAGGAQWTRKPQPNTLASVGRWGACTQLPLGILRVLGVDRSPEEMESQLLPDTPQSITPAWSGVLSQPHLHLGPSGWLSLENRQDRRGCVNLDSPHRTQFAMAVPIKYGTLSHCNALLAAFPGKF